MKRRPGFLRRLGRLALVLLLLFTLVVVGFWLWLGSSGGQAFIRDQVVEATKDSLAGRLEFERADFVDGHLVLEGVELYTPEGELVGRVARAELDVDVIAASRGHYRLSQVKLDGATVNLVHDERGLNLVRALALKNPSPGPGKPLDLTLDDVELTNSDASYTKDGKTVRVEKLHGHGHASVKTQPLLVDASLELEGVATDPVKGPVVLRASTTSPKPGALRVDANLRFADEVVKGTFDWPAFSTTVEEVRVTPALVTALTGTEVLKRPITLHGTASTTAGKLAAQSGKGSLMVDGTWDLDAGTVSSLQLDARDLDLSEWLDRGKPSRIDAKLSGSAQNLTLEKLSGDLRGTGTWKSEAGTVLAEAELNVTAKDGRATVKKVQATVPGARLELSGAASLKTLGLAGTLEATDLSRINRTVEEFTGAKLPPLSGKGSLAVTLDGPTRRPKVTATGQLDGVRVDSVAARSLSIDVTMPDVTKPLDTDGTVVATSLQLGQQTLDEVKGTIATHGRELTVALTTKGLGDFSISGSGRLDDDSNGVAISALTVNTGMDTWTLSQPTTLAWGRTLRLEETTVTAGAQRLRGAVELTGKRLKGALHASEVELARLPKIVFPATLGLGGVVTLDGTVEGLLPRPNVVAKGSVRDGQLRGVRTIVADLDGSFIEGRAKGTVKGGCSLGEVDARFDVPVDAVIEERSEALEIAGELRAVNLETLQRWLKSLEVPPQESLVRRGKTRIGFITPESPLPITGTVGATFSAKGPANDPAIAIVATGESTTFSWGTEPRRQWTLAPVKVDVSTNGQGTLAATVDAVTLGATVKATLQTPLTVPGLRRRLPTVEELETLPVSLDGTASGIAIESLRSLGVPGLDDVTGTASLKVTARGSLDDPRGLVTLGYQHLNAPPLMEMDGQLELTAGEGLTRLAGKGRADGKPLFELESVIDTSLARLQHLDRLGKEHLTAHLSLAPMPLGRLLPKREDDEPAPTGALSVELDVKGTLDDPKVTLDGVVQNLSFGKIPLGQARLVSRTVGKEQSVSLTLKATGASELRMTGTVGLDPSIEMVRNGLEWTSIPLDLQVTSRAFELGFLSGVHPLVRTVGGQLTVQNFKVTGFAGNPDIAGDVDWKKGRLALASFGDYREIDLETRVSRERIAIDRLSVRAGSGGFAMDPAVATRQSTGIWTFSSTGSATRFPIVTDDQLLAIVNLKYALEGEVSEAMVDLKQVDIARMDVELPEVKRRNVQNLERPTDIVIMRQGRVVAGKRKLGPSTTRTPTRTYRANLTAPRNIWVRSSDVNLELGLSDGFRIEYADGTQLFGEARVLGGRIDVIGREFKVARTAGQDTEATVRFAGAARQPYVNVSAVHVNERENVKVTVNVVGRGTDVQIKVSSDPAMSESEIYALLATGRRDLRRSSGSSITADQAVSVVGSFAANQLKNALIKRLPIDLFDTISVEAGAEGLETARVELGKYLSDSLYLGYTLQAGANEARGESQHTGRLEYQVSKRVSLELTAGSAFSVGADLVFSFDK